MTPPPGAGAACGASPREGRPMATLDKGKLVDPAIEVKLYASIEHGSSWMPSIMHRTDSSSAASTLSAYEGGKQTGAHFLMDETGRSTRPPGSSGCSGMWACCWRAAGRAWLRSAGTEDDRLADACEGRGVRHLRACAARAGQAVSLALSWMRTRWGSRSWVCSSPRRRR
ncbi:hypothetical protein LSPH26S_03826 [Lysinibacillus sphaericus]